MGKTHEALFRAEKEYQTIVPQLSNTSQKSIVGISPKKKLVHSEAKRYEELKIRLQTQCSYDALKVIMFTATNHGDGSSTTAVGFASYLTRVYQLKVLLMDVNLRTPSLHKYFDIEQTHRLWDIFSNDKLDDLENRDIINRNLYVITCNGELSESASFFASSRFAEFLKAMRKGFDYVILDTAPVLLFPESRIISSKVDGVFLILKSEKTRRKVALKAKKELELAGGNFLGVILNKRKYYIPNWIYKRL